MYTCSVGDLLLINPAFHELDILDGVSVVCVCNMNVAIWSLKNSWIAVLHVSRMECSVTWFWLNILLKHYDHQ